MRAGEKRPSIIRSSTSEGACRTACHVAIRNPLRIGPGATRKILAAWAAWKSRRRRRRGARGHATYTDAQSFAHRSCATQDPTARRPAFQVGEVLTWHATWRHAILCASALGTRKIAGRPPEGPRPANACLSSAGPPLLQRSRPAVARLCPQTGRQEAWPLA